MSPEGATFPLWHCSVALRVPRFTAQWSAADLALARRAAEIVLRGVGDPIHRHEGTGQVALHTRRRMTEAEAKLLLEAR